MTLEHSTNSRHAAAEYLAAAVLGVAAMAAVQTGVAGLAGNDSYYHLKMAQMLPSHGFIHAFPWLHWTIFRDQFVSHHHGFHTLLAPLVWIAERIGATPELAGKAAICLGMGVSAALLVLVLRARGVEHRLWWVLLLCCAPWHFWLRMSYLRAPIVALPLLVLAVWLVVRHRPLLLAFVAFVFAQVYGGVVLMPLVTLAFVGGALVCGDGLRKALICLAASVAGIGAGLILNPYFPHNLVFLKTQLFDTGLGGARDIGTEWRPFESWFLLKLSAALAAVWLVALLRRLTQPRRADPYEIGLLLLNLAFLILTIKSRRFVEYWPVFALINAADMGRFLVSERAPATERQRTRLRRVGAALLAVLIAGVSVTSLRHARSELRVKHNHAAIEQAMAFLQSHSEPGSLVFTDDWDVFPVLFYYNIYNHYIVGLDPVFTSKPYPTLWERYRIITRGQSPRDLPHAMNNEKNPRVTLADIGREFAASYVFVADDHPDFYKQLTTDSAQFERIYPPLAESAGEDRQPAVALFAVRRD